MRNVWVINDGFGADIETAIIDETKLLMTEKGCEYYKAQGRGDTVGSWSAPLSNIFYSEDECMTEYKRRNEEKKDVIRNKITDVASLVESMYSETYGEEYTNWEARAVFKEKAKELLGIDLD